jgi:hypothetical protein
MFAGRISIKKTIRIQAAYTLKLGISNPIPKPISSIAVRYTISVFRGIMEGIIIVIPLV